MPVEVSSDAARHQDAAARPEGEGAHRARSRGRVAVLHARLSAGHRPRLRLHRRGRRRQRVPRLRRRHRRQLRPATRIRRSSRRSPIRPAGSSTCRAPTSTTSRRCGSRRRSRRSRRSTAARGRSSATPAPRRSRRRIKLARYATGRPDDHRVPRRLSRPHAGRAGADRSKTVQRRGFGPFMPASTTRRIRTAIAARRA